MDLITINLDDYQPHPQNPNGHPDKQLGELERSLDDFGQFKNVVIWRGYYLAGHGLVEAARRKGLTTLEAVDMSHLSEDKALALMVADNRLPELAVMDDGGLAEILKIFDEPLDIPGIDDDFLKNLGIGYDNGKEPEAPQIDKAVELQEKWGTQLGQVWSLGEHRLAVGDCTDKTVVESVMRGDDCEGVITDPPYSFGLSSISQMAGKSGGWHDMMNNASWFVDRYKQWSALISTGPLWVFCNWRTLPILMRAGFDSKLGIDSVMVWYKDWIGPGGQKGLRPTYELITLTTLRDYAIPNRGVEDFIIVPWSSHKPTGHKAEKPHLLIEHLIKCSDIGLIFDPFLGSGTTLIACENLSRNCRGIEIDPGYAAVCLERFFQHTNTEPVLL